MNGVSTYLDINWVLDTTVHESASRRLRLLMLGAPRRRI